MMPMVAMSVAISLVWILFFDNAFGILNYGLQGLGLEGIEWITSPEWALVSLIIVGNLAPHAVHDPHPARGAPVAAPDPFEAARIDGASRWQMLVHITLPLLKTHIMVALICGRSSGSRSSTPSSQSQRADPATRARP